MILTTLDKIKKLLYFNELIKLKEILTELYHSSWNLGVIEAGTNITFSGDGTQASPLVINSSGGGGSQDLQSVLDEGAVADLVDSQYLALSAYDSAINLNTILVVRKDIAYISADNGISGIGNKSIQLKTQTNSYTFVTGISDTYSTALELEEPTAIGGKVVFPDVVGGTKTVAYNEDVKPYKVYTAVLTQTGTNAPVATILENTFGENIVWSYGGTGTYYATVTTNTFDNLYAITPSESVKNSNISFRFKIIIKLDSSVVTNKQLVLTTMDNSGSFANAVLLGQPIEIKVYN